jgi:hypothetical protein
MYTCINVFGNAVPLTDTRCGDYRIVGMTARQAQSARMLKRSNQDAAALPALG